MVLAGLSLHTNTPGILVGESKAKWLPYNGHPVPSEPPYTVSLKMKKAKQSKKKKTVFHFLQIFTSGETSGCSKILELLGVRIVCVCGNPHSWGLPQDRVHQWEAGEGVQLSSHPCLPLAHVS